MDPGLLPILLWMILHSVMPILPLRLNVERTCTLDDSAADAALSRLNLSLSETLVLDVLNYQKKDVLSCLKFFDWTGRQPGFHHTRATFNAIFRILSKAKLKNLMLDFLQNYMKQRYVHKVRYCNILVIGYAVAGKCETALQLFGRMRFLGVDLDAFAYHVLMNSLVDEGYFDVVETVAKEIRIRGLQNEVTHSIVMKNFCKQNELERGEVYLRGLLEDNGSQLSGIAFVMPILPLRSMYKEACRENMHSGRFKKHANIRENKDYQYYTLCMILDDSTLHSILALPILALHSTLNSPGSIDCLE